MSKLVVHKSKPPPPEPPPKPATWIETAIELALVGCAIVGMVTVAAWVSGPPVPRVGLDCWRVEKFTAAGREQDSACYPARGWHWEIWPGHAEPVPVPDRAQIVRRRSPVRDSSLR